ncbi:MAG TPA: YkvA family protein [Gemmatimonadota bacterium]|nr:YkvA family protein [Gemmatimonadota bacterium]
MPARKDLQPIDGDRPESARNTLREIALFLPNFVVLLKRLVSDPRVPRKSKLILGGTIMYLVSPIDVVPDFVPGLGQLDDVVVALLALHSILNRVDDEVVVEHWPGDENVIRMVRAGLSAVAQLVPGKWGSRV